ncbi:MAG: restriction endonuclease subunit S [Janthinobacterium lividum]
MNHTLEQLAQTLFQQWFVAFDFPDAQEQPYRSSGGELVESELGDIPQGWRVGKTQDAFSTVGGGTPSTSNPDFWENGGIPWTTPKDLTGVAAPVMLDTERRITKIGLAKISSGLLPTGTLLLSSRAPIGYLAITQLPVAINQGYIALNAKGYVGNLYMLFWLKQNMDVVKGRANGTTFQEISKGSFRDIYMILPDAATANRFDQIAQQLFARIVANETQSRTLTTLRDTLLPQLLSGRLTVRQAAALVG